MSYEGYTQVLCSNGHYKVFDAYDESWRAITSYGDIQEAKKCACGAPYVWSHEVDETNCEGVPFELEVEEAAKFEICNLGHKHYTEPARYKIPERN